MKVTLCSSSSSQYQHHPSKHSYRSRDTSQAVWPMSEPSQAPLRRSPLAFSQRIATTAPRTTVATLATKICRISSGHKDLSYFRRKQQQGSGLRLETHIITTREAKVLHRSDLRTRKDRQWPQAMVDLHHLSQLITITYQCLLDHLMESTVALRVK